MGPVQVELSITSRIGGLVAGEETEKKRSGWKKKKMTLMMVAQSSVKAKAELKRREAELEEVCAVPAYTAA